MISTTGKPADRYFAVASEQEKSRMASSSSRMPASGSSARAASGTVDRDAGTMRSAEDMVWPENRGGGHDSIQAGCPRPATRGGLHAARAGAPPSSARRPLLRRARGFAPLFPIAAYQACSAALHSLRVVMLEERRSLGLCLGPARYGRIPAAR